VSDLAKKKILEAALKEFATRGYEAASTNAIATEAQVAKGLVFHHFGNKEQLFEALFEMEVERLTTAVFETPEPWSTDLFERLHQLMMRKMELAKAHPLTLDFLMVALTEAPPRLKIVLGKKQATLMQAAWPRVLEGLEVGRLRRGLSLSDAIETLTFLSEGMERQLIALIRHQGWTVQQVGQHAWKYFERLRDGLYRK
jgi:TetR/AcrR family transcriptional regulator